MSSKRTKLGITKRDATADVLAKGIYPNTFTRRLVDFAAMITLPVVGAV